VKLRETYVGKIYRIQINPSSFLFARGEMCTEILHKYLPGLAPEVDDYVCGRCGEYVGRYS